MRNNLGQTVRQPLEAIAGMQSQTGTGCCGHRTILERAKKISRGKTAPALSVPARRSLCVKATDL